MTFYLDFFGAEVSEISFINQTSGNYVSLSGDSIDVSGLALEEGDYLIFAAATGYNTGTDYYPVPTGFTQLNTTFVNDSIDTMASLCLHRHDGVSSSYSIPAGGATSQVTGWTLLTLRNVGGLDSTIGTTTVVNSFNPPSGSVTPATDGAAVIAAVFSGAGAVEPQFVDSNGHTDGFYTSPDEELSGAYFGWSGIGYKLNASGSTEIDIEIAISDNINYGAATMIFAIQPTLPSRATPSALLYADGSEVETAEGQTLIKES